MSKYFEPRALKGVASPNDPQSDARPERWGFPLVTKLRQARRRLMGLGGAGFRNSATAVWYLHGMKQDTTFAVQNSRE
jgi:hypothetical protein